MDEIKNIISQVIGKLSSQKPAEQNKLSDLWRNILTKKELEHAQLVGVKDGKLLVNVDSPAWLYQMHLKKNNILNKFKEQDPQIKSISLKIGKVK